MRLRHILDGRNKQGNNSSIYVTKAINNIFPVNELFIRLSFSQKLNLLFTKII